MRPRFPPAGFARSLDVVLRAAFGFGCPVVAVVSFVLVVGSHSALVRCWSRCACGGFVCQSCFSALGVGLGPSRLALFLVFRCAVVSFHLFRCSAPCVGRPSRNLDKTWKFGVVSKPFVSSIPRIPALEIAECALEILFEGAKTKPT